MSKTLIIRLFILLPLVIAGGSSSAFNDLSYSSLRIPLAASLVDTVAKVEPIRGQAIFPDIGWIVFGLFLLLLPAYFLYKVRTKHARTADTALLRQQIEQLYHDAPCGYYSIDEQGVIVNINQTLLDWLGYQREEVVGRMSLSRFTESDDVYERIRNIQRDQKTHKLHVSLIRKSGGEFPVVLLRTKIADGPRPVYGALDNRECHEALERSKNLDQELESFSYSISHDLRAPLRSIDGYSRILQEDYAAQLGDEGVRVLTVIMNNAKRMGRLIDDLLEFGRLGRKVLHPVHLDMTALAKGVAHDLLLQSSLRNIAIDIETLHDVFGDAEMVRQVWQNLLENAIKFTGKTDNPTIAVRSSVIGDREVCYEVRDNGVGFDMKYASKLYGIFQRLHKIQDFSGTGVGLAIVKRIISRHGGRVWAEGSLQTGAIFYFTIPKQNNDA